MKQILFIQGGGDDGFNADKPMVSLLQKALGKDYKINYPQLPSDDTPDFGWLKQIGKEIDKSNDDVIIVAHSLGASMLLKYLSENKVSKKISGIFLLATPFWSGKEEWKQGLKLKEDFAEKIPHNYRFTFYHCRDDDEVPFDHFKMYQQKLPKATFREFENGGHQLGDNINILGKDIKGV